MSAVLHNDDVREFLTFTLGDQEYGVDIQTVQEIRGHDAITRLPDSPDYIRGIINLRGKVVPAIDLRIKFKLERADYTAQTVMIILNLGDNTVGIVVDSVSDVVALSPNQFRPTAQFDKTFDARLLIGVGMIEQRMLLLLDMEKVLMEPALVSAIASADQGSAV